MLNASITSTIIKTLADYSNSAARYNNAKVRPRKTSRRNVASKRRCDDSSHTQAVYPYSYYALPILGNKHVCVSLEPSGRLVWRVKKATNTCITSFLLSIYFMTLATACSSLLSSASNCKTASTMADGLRTGCLPTVSLSACSMLSHLLSFCSLQQSRLHTFHILIINSQLSNSIHSYNGHYQNRPLVNM